jgi:uncharacterized protein YjbJ (UPF0337 family)
MSGCLLLSEQRSISAERRLRTADRPTRAIAQSQKRGGFAMKWHVIQGTFRQMRGAIREKWGEITNNECERIAGTKDIMVGKLQERYAVKKRDAEKQLERWMEFVSQQPAWR